MTTAVAPNRNSHAKPPATSREFRELTATIASSLLTDWVGAERAKEATGRIAAALAASAASAKNPNDFYECTPQSIGKCIAIAALTQIMPGAGPAALAYCVPKRPRKGEPPQLQFWFSHRGLAALAARGGFLVIPVPVGLNDSLSVVDGEVTASVQSPDDPPMTWEDLRGVTVIVKAIATGVTLFRGWVPKKLIDQRRRASDTFRWAEGQADWAKQTSPWHAWPVEMAMKTGIHYAIGRGWCMIDDTAAMRALSIEQAQDVITVESRKPATLEQLKAAVGGDDESPRAAMADTAAPTRDEINADLEQPAQTETWQPADSKADDPPADEPPATLRWQKLIADCRNEADLTALVEALDGPDGEGLSGGERRAIQGMLDAKHEDLVRQRKKTGKKDAMLV